MTGFIQGGVTSLLQIGFEKTSGKQARMYSTHTLLNVEEKFFIGVEINAVSTKFSFDLPK